MHELRLASRKPFKNCVRVVGEVLGIFHPHGGTAVYDSLVRMAQGRQVHCLSIRLGVNRHHHFLRSLVTFYSSFNLVFDAHCVNESSNNMNPLRWNMVIASYVRNGLFQEALSVYRKMLEAGIRPDDFTFPSVLKACGEQLNLTLGREIHRTIAASNCKCSVYVQNALISMYGKCGEVQVARNLFDEMLERDLVTWNSIVAVYASKGMWEEAFDLFQRMLSEGNEVSIIMWNTIAAGQMQSGKFVEALKLLSKTRTIGLHLDSVGTVIGLTACSHVQDVELGQQFHASAIHGGFDAYHNVMNALITMYSRCENLRDAYIVFQLTENKSIVTWNAMISGYSYCDRLDEASFLFREMFFNELEPNHVTIASILPLFGRVADLQRGREFHCYILRREGFTGNSVLWNSIIDVYVRSGKIFQARGVFDTLDQKNEIAYTSLIAGYGAQGQGEVALNLFKEMCCYGIKPDHVSLLAVLSACSHSGLVNHGELLFEKLESNFGIRPRLEHFSCMVNLYARAGLLRKAADVIRGMPYHPTLEMWVTLIGACRVHGNMNLGEWAAEKLLEVKPKNSGYYVLIANMYAAAGCWSKLAGVRTLMRDLGVNKARSYAWVDLGTGFQPFSAGDVSADLMGEIYLLLEGVTEHMKDASYDATEDFFIHAGIFKGCPTAEDTVDVKIWGSLVL